MKLLIADDEALIREGIRNHIDWCKYGIDVVGVVENGLAALRILENEPVDILVTDIRMPRMDGIELSRAARLRYPNIRIIILSGYEEFEFAQQALELSVMKYLLKPFTRPELEEAVVQAKDEVDSMRQVERQMNVTLDRLQRSLPLLRDRYLNDWVSGRLLGDDILSKLQLVDIEPAEGQHAVIITVIDEVERTFPQMSVSNQTDMLSVLLLEEMSQWMKESGNGVAFQGKTREIVAVMSGVVDANQLFAFAERIREQARQAFELTVSVCLGGLKEQLTEVTQSYQEALEAMDYRFLVGEDSIVPYDWIHLHTQQSWVGVPDEYTDKIISAIRTGQEDLIRSELNRLFEWLKGIQSIGHSDVKVYMTEFLVSVLTAAVSSGTRLKDIYAKEYNPYAFIVSAKTMDDLKRELEALFLDLSRFILDKRGDRKKRVIEQAVDYIRLNYHQEDLSINVLSEQMDMNPTYFSKLFKKEIGSTFTDYVTKTRLEQAKRDLRETALRVNEIAYRVGYRDPFYFSTLFKKHTGVNPSDFRDFR
ncbi:response regulator [Cohnella sp. WQ 127256]|uniref:response regulator n=1 Tax=Cohnella sp. WQ 127256 TaxID=2938790 RepID=UPI0021193537|nr:response regulator [Cohnella sp. WQ 127256]